MKRISTFILAIFLVFTSLKISAQCISGETEIDFVASGVSGGWSDYALLMGSSSSYLINTPGSNLECITNGLCYTVNLTGSAILDIYQAGVLVATPTNGETICFPFVPSNPGCTDPIADNYDALATIDDGSCMYNNCNSINGFNYIGTIGSCCYYEYNDTTTWTAATALCVSNGGNLVSINTVQESDSLNLLLGNNNTGGNQHWINLIDGSSNWQNGDPLIFTNYDGSYNAVNADYMFLQNNGFWDNSPNDGSQSNDGIYPLMEICQSLPCSIVPAGSVSVFNSYNVSCNGQNDGSIIASASGGTGTFTYSIDGINFQSNALFSALMAGNYTITYKDANGCIETEQLTLTEPPNLLGSAIITQFVDCFGASTGEIGFTVDPLNPGVPPYQYSIDNGSNYQSSNTFNNLVGNITYNVMIEDSNGCQYTSSIFLNEPPLLSANASVVDASCYGISDGVVTINISGGVPNYTINAFGGILPLSTSSFTTTASIPAGTYPYSVIDSNNCSFNDVVTVAEPALISSTDSVTTCGNYSWIDGNTYTSNNNTATYTLIAVDGCDSVVSLNLSLIPNIINTVVDTACGEYLFGVNYIDTSGTYVDTFFTNSNCDSIVTLELTIFEDSSFTYITACDSAEWNGVWYYNDTTVTVTGLVTTPAGCDSVATAIIDIKNSSSTYTQVAQCDSFTWALNGQTYFTSQIDTFHSINADSCLHIDSLDLTIYPEINLSAIITDELCVNYSDGSIILAVSGGLGSFSYSWSGPNSFSETTKDIFNLSPGIYNLTITDITSFCVKDTFFVVGAGFDMQITSSYTDVSCYGFSDGTIDIISINLISPTYTWSDISTSLEDRINMPPGIYYLQIHDNNCFVRDTFIITEPDSLFIISLQTTSVCLGSNSGEITVQTFGGSPGYDYYWSSLTGNSPVSSNLTSGTYDLDIYDNNDCLFEETFEILSYEMIVSSVVDNIDCFGSSTGSIDLTVSGGFPNYTYIWSDNSINEDIYNLSAGSITCTINDYLGCENIVSFNLTQEPQLSITPVVTGVSCYGGSDGSASLLISGGVSTYNIDWENADENNLEEGYYPYEITDANGCTFNDSVYIPQEDSLILDIIQVDLQCNGDPTGKIDAIVLSGGMYPYTYTWVGPNNFTANQYIISDLYAGLYTLTVSDANNCDVEFQITLSQPTAVSQDVDFEFSNYSTYGISCKNGSDGWINAIPSGGFIPYSFSWDGPNGFNSVDQNITNLSKGIYNVTITNALGCDEQFSFPMNDPVDALGGVVNSLYDYNGYDVSCYGFNDGGILVEANGGVSPYTYVWDNVQTLNPLPFQQAGIHLLTMYDNNGCEWESFIVLDQPDELIWTIEMFPDTCEREVGATKIELEGGVLPYDYLWNDGQTTFAANQLFEGEYNVQVIDKNDCQVFDTIQVSNLVGPKMDFAIMSDYERLYKQLEDPIVFIDITELTWQNALYWHWDFGDGTYGTDSIAFHSYQETGEYDVLLKVTTDYNCIDTLVKKVIIEEYNLFIPNAFTPNSSEDNINEEFRPYGFGISEFQMNIYSRWGELIYSTTNIESGWNGQFDNSGAEVQIGVYLYYIKTKDVFGAIHKYTGEINLIR